MTEQICLKMRINGQDEWYPVVPWGTRWYESDMQFEVLLEEVEDIEIHIESLTGNEMRVETVSMEELPKRKDYALRLQVKHYFWMKRHVKLALKILGLGNFFRQLISTKKKRYI